MYQQHQSAARSSFNVILVDVSKSGDLGAVASTRKYNTSDGRKIKLYCSVVDDMENYEPEDVRIEGAIIFSGTSVGVSKWRRVLRGLPTVTADDVSSLDCALLELAQKMTADPNLRF